MGTRVDTAAAGGTPRRVRVGADGARVVFLRGGALWSYEVYSGTGYPVTGGYPGIGGYAIDAAARTAAFPVAGVLHRADLVTGEVAPVRTAGPVRDPRPDPSGRRIGYLGGGGLRVVELDPTGRPDTLLAGEPDPAEGGHPHVTWGAPEPAATRLFGRRRGWWWAPDGESALAVRVDHARPPARVSLHLLDLDGSWVDVHWDRETYPYLVSVGWSRHGGPLVTVLRRPQQHGLVLAVDPRTGETQVHAELADPRWVEPVPGTPCHLVDGRVLVGGELAHDGYDARCLFADGTLLTPPSLYVRRVVGPLPASGEILVAGSAGEPSEQHLFRVSTAAGAGGIDAPRLTTAPGWHRGVVGGGTVVVGSRSLEHTGIRWTVWRGDEPVGRLAAGPSLPPAAAGSLPRAAARSGRRAAERPRVPPRPQLARVTDRRLPTGVLYPPGHVSGRPLPVLVDTAGGLDQGVRAVRADWVRRRRWAEAGLAVAVVDHRGTPGVAPSFEKVVHRRLADVALADLVDALAALAGKHPDLDLARVAVRGHGVGGWLAALAALRRRDAFRCAVAEAPVVDWTHPDPAVSERYLGPPDDGTDVYHHHCLLAAARDAAADPASGGGSGGGSDVASGRADPPALLLVVPDPPADPQVARLAALLPSATVLPGPPAGAGSGAVARWVRDRLDRSALGSGG